MEETEHIRDAIRIIWGKRKTILQWTALVFICSALLSLLLKNYYQATTTFYPASLDLSKPDQLFGHSTHEMDFYGSSQDLDRLLTICHSNEIKDQLVRNFNLYQHYDIDSTGALAHHKIRKKLDKLMTIIKTKYDAIDLSIEDKDKILAASMANAARNYVNAASSQLITTRLMDVVRTYQSSIDDKQRRIDLLDDSLMFIRKKYPIYNIDAQTESMISIATNVSNDLSGEQARYEALKKSGAPRDTLMYLSARIKGLESQLKSINSGESFNLTNFNEGVSKVSSIEQAIERLQSQINEDRIRHQQTVTTIESGALSLITVNQAEVPIYKSRPMRSILVLATTFLSFVSLCLYYLLKKPGV
ncbi:MAG: hypothetical protein IPK94_18935 [Saprospiraceae bacterium]|nr:hypothetical protein [Saprospiraceae bacterium]